MKKTWYWFFLSFFQLQFLKELGLQEDNNGVYAGGEWKASGEVITSYNPATGKPIARVRRGTKEDYERCIQVMEANKRDWQKVRKNITSI